jgi:hypothetical protein
MRHLFPVFVLALGFCATAVAHPEFELGGDVAGGQLSWSGHTVAPCLDAPVPPDDHIAEDAEAKTLSLGLHWNSTPDATTGECLASTYYWKIPHAELVASRYRVTVERAAPAEVVFVLTPESGAGVALRSPRCQLVKAHVGKFEDVTKFTNRIDAQALLKDAEKNEPAPVQIDFGPVGWPQVWTSLHDEFVKEVKGCKPWLDAPAAGLAPRFVFHAAKLQESFGDFGLPKADMVVPLDDAARVQLLGFLRDDMPVKVSAEKWADGECATLNEALPIFTVTVEFEKKEYCYTIDPIFGLVDVRIGGRPELYTDNLPLAEKFVELYARQMHDERIKTVIAETRRRNYGPEEKP